MRTRIGTDGTRHEQSFSCRRIGNEWFLTNDLQEICPTTSDFSYWYSVFATFGWTFGIPGDTHAHTRSRSCSRSDPFICSASLACSLSRARALSRSVSLALALSLTCSLVFTRILAFTLTLVFALGLACALFFSLARFSSLPLSRTHTHTHTNCRNYSCTLRHGRYSITDGSVTGSTQTL